MPTVRTITVWEDQSDKEALSKNGTNLHFAKGVATTPWDAATYNTVWTSKAIASRTVIRWDTTYGLNWTTTLPDEGGTVDLGGQWQAVSKGQNVKLNQDGFFDTPVSGGMSDFISVTSIDYSYPGARGIYLVVGVRNGGDFDPIFIDTRMSFRGGSARYSPTEKIQCWYEAGSRGSTIISQNRTGVMELDCTNATKARNMFEWWINYMVSSASWNVSESKPVPS